MFEFLYAKKVNDERLIKVIEDNLDKYHMDITFHKNGSVEVFIGTNRKKLTDELKERNIK